MSEPQLPANNQSRVGRIESIFHSLSDFERDELITKLGTSQLHETCLRLQDGRISLALCLHTMMFCGVFFGGFLGLGLGAVIGVQEGFWAGLATFAGTALGGGFFFGLIVAAYMIAWMRIFMPRFVKNLNKQQSAAFQVQELELPVQAAEAFEVCLSSLAAPKGMRMESIDRENLSVRAVTAFTWKSPGEIVGVKVDPLAADTSRVRVYSKAMFTTLDFGKNRANVTSLAKSIEDAGQVHVILKSI
ncbi:MAG: hypothetical protein K2X93_28070 [Candidatus Obscuribacterales bacterium]|nr:hypothetical protein [Candidatus Obscuribacterales bacterium]